MNEPQVETNCEKILSNGEEYKKFFPVLEIFLQYRDLFHCRNISSSQTSLAEMLSGIIAEIDRRITDQLNLILHNESFQRLEGTWRGLCYLVSRTPVASNIKVRVFNLSYNDMARSLKKYPGVTWDQSPLFKAVYENEFGTAGGEPFGCLIGDYYFDETPPCIETMKSIARIASSAHVPFISGASPAIMNMESWRELSNPRDYNRIFRSPEHIFWRNFRENPDSRYIVLTLPRVLARIPYGSQTLPVNGLDFEEEIGAGNHNNYCWMNAAFVMGLCAIRAFRQYGWCVRLCGYDSCGRSELAPVGITPSLLEDLPYLPLIETAVTTQGELELAGNGLSVLCALKNSSQVVFQSGRTVYKPKLYSSALASKNEDLSSRLSCLFAVCRFAHYIKCILRDKVGSFHEQRELELFLNDWLAKYVAGDAEASDEIKAKYPLAEASVHITPRTDNPGQYDMTIYLRPHYQLDGLTVPVRLTAQVPEKEKA